MLVRCKRLKIPGDGGVVDGCGWQGVAAGQCPSCGSRLLRPLSERITMKPGYEPKTLLGEMGQICEEAGEVLKHFGKILRFGIDNVYVDQQRIYTSMPESNRQAFYRELDDLEACIKRIKARHARFPSEPLGLGHIDQYAKLAEAAQSYLECLADAEAAAKEDPGHPDKVPGVRRRGRLREARANLNALVGVALGKSTT